MTATTTTPSSIESIPTGLFIAGQWRDAAAGRVFGVDVENPATGEILAVVADAGPSDGDEALAAAVAAQSDWARTAPRYRSEVLRNAFDLVMQRKDWLAEVMTSEMGKPLAESAEGEVACRRRVSALVLRRGGPDLRRSHHNR